MHWIHAIAIRIMCFVYNAWYTVKDTLHEMVYPRGEYHIETVLWINNRDHHKHGEPDVIDATDTMDQIGDLPTTDEMADYRIEVRYIFDQKPYRFVISANDVAKRHFPPYDPDKVCPEPFAKRILSATIRYEDGATHDITGRLRKYAGPRGDFYGWDIPASWVVPMLHHTSLRGARMTVVDTGLRIQTLDLDDPDARIEWNGNPM